MGNILKPMHIHNLPITPPPQIPTISTSSEFGLSNIDLGALKKLYATWQVQEEMLKDDVLKCETERISIYLKHKEEMKAFKIGRLEYEAKKEEKP